MKKFFLFSMIASLSAFSSLAAADATSGCNCVSCQCGTTTNGKTSCGCSQEGGCQCKPGACCCTPTCNCSDCQCGKK